jgi:hypothetical protein
MANLDEANRVLIPPDDERSEPGRASVRIPATDSATPILGNNWFLSLALTIIYECTNPPGYSKVNRMTF